MLSVSAGLRAALDSRLVVPVSRISSLDSSLAVRATWEAAVGTGILLGGSVSCDRTRQVRRSGSIEVKNDTGALSPQVPGDYFYRDEIILLERGALVGSTPTYCPLATLVITDFTTTMAGHLSFTADDLLSLADQPIGEILSVAVGTTAEDVVLMFLEPVLGDGSGWALDGNGQTVAVAQTPAEDDNRLATVTSIVNAMGLELFADRLGSIVLRPVPDPTLQSVAKSYVGADTGSLILSLARSGAARPFNRFVVIGDNPGAAIIRAELDVDDPSSPVIASRIGLRVAPYDRSAQIVDQAQANALALADARRLSFRQDAITGTFVPDPTLDEGDVVYVSEPVTRTDGDYWLATVDQPLVLGTMGLAGPSAIPLFT